MPPIVQEKQPQTIPTTIDYQKIDGEWYCYGEKLSVTNRKESPEYQQQIVAALEALHSGKAQQSLVYSAERKMASCFRMNEQGAIVNDAFACETPILEAINSRETQSSSLQNGVLLLQNNLSQRHIVEISEAAGVKVRFYSAEIPESATMPTIDRETETETKESIDLAIEKEQEEALALKSTTSEETKIEEKNAPTLEKLEINKAKSPPAEIPVAGNEENPKAEKIVPSKEPRREQELIKSCPEEVVPNIPQPTTSTPTLQMTQDLDVKITPSSIETPIIQTSEVFKPADLPYNEFVADPRSPVHITNTREDSVEIKPEIRTETPSRYERPEEITVQPKQSERILAIQAESTENILHTNTVQEKSNDSDISLKTSIQEVRHQTPDPEKKLAVGSPNIVDLEINHLREKDASTVAIKNSEPTRPIDTVTNKANKATPTQSKEQKEKTRVLTPQINTGEITPKVKSKGQNPIAKPLQEIPLHKQVKVSSEREKVTTNTQTKSPIRIQSSQLLEILKGLPLLRQQDILRRCIEKTPSNSAPRKQLNLDESKQTPNIPNHQAVKVQEFVRKQASPLILIAEVVNRSSEQPTKAINRLVNHTILSLLQLQIDKLRQNPPSPTKAKAPEIITRTKAATKQAQQSDPQEAQPRGRRLISIKEDPSVIEVKKVEEKTKSHQSTYLPLIIRETLKQAISHRPNQSLAQDEHHSESNKVETAKETQYRKNRAKIISMLLKQKTHDHEQMILLILFCMNMQEIDADLIEEFNSLTLEFLDILAQSPENEAEIDELIV